MSQPRTHIDFTISQPRPTTTNDINTILPEFFLKFSSKISQLVLQSLITKERLKALNFLIVLHLPVTVQDSDGRERTARNRRLPSNLARLSHKHTTDAK